MDKFLDGILELCEKEIEEYSFPLGKKVANATKRHTTALFIKAMTIMAYDDFKGVKLQDEKTKKIINAISDNRDNFPSLVYERMKDAAHAYWNEIYDKTGCLTELKGGTPRA